jgi:hypothetical protein
VQCSAVPSLPNNLSEAAEKSAVAS